MDDPITSHSDSQAVALLSVLTPIDELPLFKGDLTQEEKNTALHELVQWERAPSTFKTYLSQVRAWAVWARQKDVRVIPADPVEICSWLEYRAHDRKTKHSLSTLKQACAALVVAHTLYDSKALNPAQSELVKRMIRSLTNEKGAYQKSATGLTSTDLAAITATACRPRRGIFGRLETAETALKRGLVDIALIRVMLDAMLRRSEAAVLCWQDLSRGTKGTGTIAVGRSKTDQHGRGATLFLSRPTLEALDKIGADAGPKDLIFGLSPRQICRRIKAASEAAGLDGDYSGHSPRIGMAQDLATFGTELPALQQAGRWRSPIMPAHYIREQAAARGAVAQFYGESQ